MLENAWVVCWWITGSTAWAMVFIIIGPLLDTATLFLVSMQVNASSVGAVYLAGVPVNAIHAAATFLTLLVLCKPISEKLERINALASSSEILSCELDGTDPECPGAVKKQIWRLSEEDRTAFLDFTLSSLARIPFLSDALQNEKIRIGTQPLTEPFLRNLFSSLRGETTLTYYTDPLNQILLMQLSFPDLSSLVEDPEFRRIRGLEFRVNRSGSEEEKNLTSLTTILLPGLEGTLLSARMEMSPGSPIQPLPGNKVYEVGGLDSSGLRKLFASLSFAIAGNAVNLIMDLPPIVFHTLLGRFF